MNAILSPIVSEFETEEQESSYTKWLQEKTTDSLNDTRPNIPHDQVISKMRGMLDTKKKCMLPIDVDSVTNGSTHPA